MDAQLSCKKGSSKGIGFIGLGLMGSAMALNLVRAQKPMIVWNRMRDKCYAVADAGATVAANPRDLFARARIVFLMLANEEAIDSVLVRGTADFDRRVRGHIIVAMGTTSAQYSRQLSDDISLAGGRYVECPVSGSRIPAERGELVAMLAGDAGAIEETRPLLAPMCSKAVTCGDVPNALLMKLAVNIFLISMVSGLAEAFHFAERHGLDMQRFRTIVDAGPMASDVSRIKVDKMLNGELSAQAAIFDVLKNSRLITEQAQASSIAAPLMDVCCNLFDEALRLGHAHLDMAAVLLAIRGRTGEL
jgi:3-hydroxyisobutyrate dehydrogenase